MGRKAGVYVELKSPWFHHQHNKDLALAVIKVLAEYGYSSEEDRVFLQSFDYKELLRIHQELLPRFNLHIPLVQLIAEDSWLETYERTASGEWQTFSYAWMLEDAGLFKLAEIVKGVGPSYDMLITNNAKDGKVQLNNFVQQAHKHGLQVHPYTFRADQQRLPPYVKNLEELLRLFIEQGKVDGVFTDQPKEVLHYLQKRKF